jgi:hypothetical protein
MRRFFRAALLSTIFALLVITPVLAISSAYTLCTIEKVYAYHNLLEENDVAVIVFFQMTYGTNPTETITDAMLGRFLSAGGVELSNATLYSFYNDGYSTGIYRFYWPASTAPDYSTIDSSGYTVEFAGNPTLSWSGAIPLVSVASINKKGAATLTATSVLLAANVLSWANDLGNDWTITMTEQAGSTTVLHSNGVQYFTNVIPELQQICPQIFPTGLSTPTYVDKTDNATVAKKQATNFPLDPVITPPTGFFGLDAQWMKFIVLAILSMVLATVVGVKTNIYVGAACVVPALVLSVNPGIISYMLLGIVAFIAALALVWAFVWSKAP